MTELILITVLCFSYLLAVIILILFALVMLRPEEEEETAQEPSAPNTLLIVPGRQVPQYERNSQSVLLENLETRQQYRVILNTPVILGRSVNGLNGMNDLGIGASSTLSRQQCRLMASGDQVYVDNLSRVNGTFLNHQRIEQAVPLRPGDLIQAADVTLIVVQIAGVLHESRT